MGSRHWLAVLTLVALPHQLWGCAHSGATGSWTLDAGSSSATTGMGIEEALGETTLTVAEAAEAKSAEGAGKSSEGSEEGLSGGAWTGIAVGATVVIIGAIVIVVVASDGELGGSDLPDTSLGRVDF